MSRDTLSRLNAEIDAMFPVLKKADWISVRKKTEIRASANVSERKGGDDDRLGLVEVLLIPLGLGFCWHPDTYMLCSNRTQDISVAEKAT